MIAIFVAMPGLIFWAFGIPLFFLGRLIILRNAVVEQAKLLENVQKQNRLAHRFRIRLGFLTSGYREEYFYWEIILLLRKSFLVLLVTFLQAVSGGMQSLTFLVIILVFFIV